MMRRGSGEVASAIRRYDVIVRVIFRGAAPHAETVMVRS
jgi:hypothetical protein